MAAMPGGGALLNDEREGGDGGENGDGTGGAGGGEDPDLAGQGGGQGGERNDPDAWIKRLPPEAQAEVRERMGRLQGQNDVLQKFAKPEGEKPKPEAKTEKAPNPLTKLTSHEQLDKVEERSEQMREWALLHLNEGGVLPGPDGQETEITPEQARQMFLYHDANLRKHIPGRRAQLDGDTQRTTAQERIAQQAQEVYPWLGKKDSPEFRVYQICREKFPELLGKYDDAPLFMADMVTGFLARRAKAAAAAKGGNGSGPDGRNGNGQRQPTELLPAEVRTPAPRPRVQPRGESGGGGRSGGRNLEDAFQAFATGGGTRDGLVSFLENMYGAPEGES